MSHDKAFAHADKLIEDGADIIDIGGESTRPGSEPVSVDEEIRRVVPVVTQIVKRHPKVPVSIDSYKPDVVKAALDEGAAMINDITGMRSPAMIELAAKWKIPTTIMHMQGTPGTMQRRPVYKNVVDDIIRFFRSRINACGKKGVEKIIVDPGIGFGKTIGHNLEILRRFDSFSKLGYPVMIGASRKSFIGKVLGNPVDQREGGTLATTAIAVMKGAAIIRVHNVKENIEAARVAHSVLKGSK